MTKKRASLIVSDNLADLFTADSVRKKKEDVNGLPIETALTLVTRQMEITGLRPRTISDYNLHIKHFIEVIDAQVLEELTVEHIYTWLSSMDVSNQTKLTRLKCLKAFLNRCFYNGWIPVNFWRHVNIKVSTPVKEGATERDVMVLLSMLDLTDFVQLRDATALLIMFQTGLRSNTVAQLENKHVDLRAKLLKVDGGLLKNHEQIYLPIDDILARMLETLMMQNDLVRREKRTKNDLVFITQHGETVLKTPTNNVLQKRIRQYSKEYGIKNVNPHALRRGFAKRLLEKGAHIAEISRALGHSDLGVTTRYLHLDKEEVAEKLRNYL